MDDRGDSECPSDPTMEREAPRGPQGQLPGQERGRSAVIRRSQALRAKKAEERRRRAPGRVDSGASACWWHDGWWLRKREAHHDRGAKPGAQDTKVRAPGCEGAVRAAATKRP